MLQEDELRNYDYNEWSLVAVAQGLEGLSNDGKARDSLHISQISL